MASLKPHILFYSNGLAIWHRFPDILRILKKKKIADAIFRHLDLIFGQCAPIFKFIWAIDEINIWYTFWSDT